METFYTANRTGIGATYYMKAGVFTNMLHYAAMMDQQTAEKIARRYSLQVEEHRGYLLNYKSLDDLGEEDAQKLLEKAAKTAKNDGLTVEQVTAIVSKVFV
jgi:hypothetical protein